MIEISRYSLFLFDFDGLLVDTEVLHYKAYVRMLASYQEKLPWNFHEYCQVAFTTQEKLRQGIEEACPDILQKEKNWNILYQKKKEEFIYLLQEKAPPLMPGVEKLLFYLQKKNICHGVVTHSAKEIIENTRKNHSLLEKIPFWITREDYKEAKPASDCYSLAIKRYGNGGGIIGFEDSPRGLTALLGTEADAVFVPSIKNLDCSFLQKEKSFYHLSSLEELTF